MSVLLLLTAAPAPTSVLPSLALLGHTVKVLRPAPAALLDAPSGDVLLVDARNDLVAARSLCRMLRTTGIDTPMIAVLTDGGLSVVNADWGLDDVILAGAGPAEIEARLRLALAAKVAERPAEEVIRGGDLTIDEGTYQARIKGRPLDLTFKEFELLKYLAQHPGRVFTRQQLLQEVWGYDYYGGTRTVDVHVRRLRAKLGPEHESLVGTVRNVGYKFVTPPIQPLSSDETVPVG
ncbi:MAG TPA: response regulator transcription factor [Frankiaceae bacterium]|nr:response regulator transcription factor [Frankiaceae bacterium]